MRFPSTLIEFQDRFPDEESCWQYLRRVRWPHGFRCPRCQGRESSFIRTRRLEQCRRCRYQASVTAGTVFHKTRVGLRVWLLGIFFVARHKKGISALQFQRDTGLGSYQTAWTLLHKLRSSLGRRTGELLSGLVEADEAYVGGPRRGIQGRGAPNKSIVALAVEQNKAAGHELGQLCVNCHGPIGATITGSETLPFPGTADSSDPGATGKRNLILAEGVSCVVCHALGDAPGRASGAVPFLPNHSGNSSLGRFQGPPQSDPDLVPVPDHQVETGGYLNDEVSSSVLCGACHIVEVDLSDNGQPVDRFADP